MCPASSSGAWNGTSRPASKSSSVPFGRPARTSSTSACTRSGWTNVYDASLSGIRVGYVADFRASPPTFHDSLTTPRAIRRAANMHSTSDAAPSTVLERQAITRPWPRLRRHLLSSAAESTSLGSTGSRRSRDLVILFTCPRRLHPRRRCLSRPSRTTWTPTCPPPLRDRPAGCGSSQLRHPDHRLRRRPHQPDLELRQGRHHATGSSRGDAGRLGKRRHAVPMAAAALPHRGLDGQRRGDGARDVSHPFLKEPNELSWTCYDTHGRAGT